MLLVYIYIYLYIFKKNYFLTVLLTGTIDMDLITTGVSASERMRRDNLVGMARNIIMEKMQLGGPSTRMLEVT